VQALKTEGKPRRYLVALLYVLMSAVNKKWKSSSIFALLNHESGLLAPYIFMLEDACISKYTEELFCKIHWEKEKGDGGGAK